MGEETWRGLASQAVVMLSALTGQGIAELDDAILEAIGAPGMAGGGVGWAVNARQSEALTRASQVKNAIVCEMILREGSPWLSSVCGNGGPHGDLLSGSALLLTQV